MTPRELEVLDLAQGGRQVGKEPRVGPAPDPQVLLRRLLRKLGTLVG